MGRVEGKVAFITGAARGQGRSHAVKLAQEGANIIGVDICAPVESNIAPSSTPADLSQTVKEVEAVGGRMIASEVDVRHFGDLQKAIDDGVKEFGRLDIVSANAGSWTYGLVHELSEKEWHETIDIVLTGVWHTCKAAVPRLIEQGEGGAIILTSSVAGLRGIPHIGHYVAAKHGVVGLMRTMANELAPYSIRVNTLNPSGVDTDLIHNRPTYELFAPDILDPTREDIAERFMATTALPVPWVDVSDVSNALLFLASDEGRYITGITLSLDAGTYSKA